MRKIFAQFCKLVPIRKEFFPHFFQIFLHFRPGFETLIGLFRLIVLGTCFAFVFFGTCGTLNLLLILLATPALFRTGALRPFPPPAPFPDHFCECSVQFGCVHFQVILQGEGLFHSTALVGHDNKFRKHSVHHDTVIHAPWCHTPYKYGFQSVQLVDVHSPYPRALHGRGRARNRKRLYV